MKTLVLQYPKQKTMYNPNIPAIRLTTEQINYQTKPDNQYKPEIKANVVDRLYEQEQRKQNRINKLRQEQEKSLTPNHKPLINKNSQRILQNKNLKPFLERQEELDQERKMKVQLQQILSNQESEQEVPKQMPSRSYSQFLKDSEDWIAYKNYKQQQLKEEIELQNLSTFHPTINQKSAQIADQKMKKSGLDLVDQADRLAMPIRQHYTFDKENYSFSPCINPKSRQLADKHKYQRSQSPWNQF